MARVTHSTPPRAVRSRPGAPGAAPPATVPPLPAPWRVAAALAAAAALVALVSFPLADPDLWQHLRTGRAIWEWRGLESRNVWTWPGYGEPYLVSSWLFRALLWPFWSVGGVAGLFVWRWLTTLACFSLLWAAARAARRPGSTGLGALFVLVWCGVLYRYRSQVRPETLVAVLLAAQLWILERRRAAAIAGESRRIDPAWWLVPIAAIWINVHLSYVLGLFVTGAYLLDDLWRARVSPGRASPGTLAAVLAASAAACFLNPYGLGLVRQPFDFWFRERGQLVFRMIAELGPVPWPSYLATGLPLLVSLPLLLAIWRWRRSGPDLAEIAILAAFIPQGLASQRFLGYAAIAIAPFFARDAGEFLATRRWPGWLVRPAVRGGLAAALAAALLVPALAGPSQVPRIGIRETIHPSAACDAIAAKDIRGRAFSMFSHGGFLIWRFWPDRDRLPFMDIHATGSPELREAFARALIDSAGWGALDRRWQFDWVMLPRSGQARGPLLETLDADTARWAAVFIDDVAAVFVRRDGRNARVAAGDAYTALPAGAARLPAALARAAGDSLTWSRLLAELDRAEAESRQCGSLRLFRGELSLARGDADRALRQFDAIHADGLRPPGIHLRRGMALFQLRRFAEAVPALETASREEPRPAQAEALLGRAFRVLGRDVEARRAWRAALRHDPTLPGLADSLAALERARR